MIPPFFVFQAEFSEFVMASLVPGIHVFA